MVPLHHAESFNCGAVFVSIGSQPAWLGKNPYSASFSFHFLKPISLG